MARISAPAQHDSVFPGESSAEVDRFMLALVHPCKTEIQSLRTLILAADPAVAEEIKWNAPSFRTSEHFATLRLRSKSGVGVIMHFGAKKREAPVNGADIPDPAGLLQWLAKDRALVSFRDAADIAAKRTAFNDLLRSWITHV